MNKYIYLIVTILFLVNNNSFGMMEFRSRLNQAMTHVREISNEKVKLGIFMDLIPLANSNKELDAIINAAKTAHLSGSSIAQLRTAVENAKPSLGRPIGKPEPTKPTRY
jgi:hypothetical protein